MYSLLSIIILFFSNRISSFAFIPRRSIIMYTLSSKLLYNNVLNSENDDNSLIHNIKNNIYYSGPLTDESIFGITTNILTLQNMIIDNNNNNNNHEINLHIKSQGGSLLPTLGLVDIIRNSNVPINTYIDGYAASAATLISIVGSKRFINKHGLLLIHQLKMGAEYSKYNEIKDFAENADTLMDIIRNLYLEYSNIDINKLNYLLDHDLWLNSTTCKEYGLVDIII
mgnify:CR=1 FL=1